jgi:hypothetical protein
MFDSVIGRPFDGFLTTGADVINKASFSTMLRTVTRNM